jgi:ketopantoate reductase
MLWVKLVVNLVVAPVVALVVVPDRVLARNPAQTSGRRHTDHA